MTDPAAFQKLEELRRSGALTEAEFSNEWSRLMGAQSAPSAPLPPAPPPPPASPTARGSSPYRRKGPIVGLAAVALIGLIAVVGAIASGSSGKGKSAANTAIAQLPVSSTISTDNAVTSPSVAQTTAAVTTAAGGSLTITDTTSGSSFDMTVGKPIALASPANNPNLFLGVPVTLSGVTGSPDFYSSNVGAAPTTSGSVADDGSGVVESVLIDRDACGKLPMLHAALATAAIDQGAVSYPLTSGMKAVTGCLIFSFDAPDSPTTIAYYTDTPTGSSSDQPVATWTIKTPAVTKDPDPNTITYSVTTDGGITDVTYSTAGFNQSQDTNIQGSTWSMTISDKGIDIASLIAQADGNASTISCTITKDGVQIAAQSSHGNYAVVTC